MSNALLYDLSRFPNVMPAVSEQSGRNFMYAYYHSKSMYFFLEYAGADLVKDESMNAHMVDKDVKERDFEVLGDVNDMFRYCFMYNDFTEEAGNYFSYFWYYYEYLAKPK